RVPVDGLSDILDGPPGSTPVLPGVPSPLPPTKVGAVTTPLPRQRPNRWLILAAVLVIFLCIGVFIVFAVRTAVQRALPTAMALQNETETAKETPITVVIPTESATEEPTDITPIESTVEATDLATDVATSGATSNGPLTIKDESPGAANAT